VQNYGVVLQKFRPFATRIGKFKLISNAAWHFYEQMGRISVAYEISC